MSKVDGNDPCTPNIVVERHNDGSSKRTSQGLPIRLEIAARIVSRISGDMHYVEFHNDQAKDQEHTNEWQEKICESALRWADMLVAKHNESLEK